MAIIGKLVKNSLVRRIAWALLLGGMVLFAFLQRNIIGMPLQYTLTSTASVHYGDGGRLLLIDQGKAALELLDSEGGLAEHWTGKNLRGFFYAEQAAAGPDGTIYLADRAYRDTEDGVTVMVERILEIRGRERRVAWESEASFDTSQSSSIYELQYYGGQVWFLREEISSIALYALPPGGSAVLKQRVYIGETINDASYDLSTNTLVTVTRRGFVRFHQEGKRDWTTVPSDAVHLMPSSVTARASLAYVSDAYASRVCRFSLEAPEDGISTFWQEGVYAIDLKASEDGKEVLASDGVGFYRIREGASTFIGEAAYASYALTVAARLALLLSVLMVLWSLRRVIPFVRELLRQESAIRVVIVVLAALTVSIFVAYSLMTELFAQEDNEMLDNMKLFAEIMRDGIDTDALRQVDWEEDYGGSAYKRVRAPLDRMIELAYGEMKEYYYALYRLDGDVLRLIMNSDDYVMCGEPYEMGDQVYSAEVQRTGISCAVRTRDADGDWVNVKIPVTDSSGIRIAVLEIGMDMGLLSQQRQESAMNMVLSVMCSTAVVMMLILEGVFLLSFMERRRGFDGAAVPGPAAVPVRTLMCLSYIADSMQEPFVAVLCVELYRGGLPLPDGVAAALPLSGELLAMAVFSALAGPLTERWGSRKLMSLGVTAQLVGSVCCFMVGNYPGVFLGKLLIGAGMGVIYVTCNTVASAGDTEESVAEAFSGISAGILSGMSIGAGLASLFLSIGGWKLVYMVGSIVMVATLALCFASGDVRLGAKKVLEEQDVSFARFFLNRRVIGFFLLILVPFMMSLSYREYFFPIFAQEHSIGEVRIGQIYLLCGLLVLYLGPGLTAWVLRTMGALWSIVAASVLMGLNMLLFVIHPSMGSVLLGVVLVYAVFSFASSCQYTFFQCLPEFALFGEGKSMGVYSVFESVGQTLGPVSYGALLTLGSRTGIGVFCAAMLLLTAIFLALMWKARKYYR